MHQEKVYDESLARYGSYIYLINNEVGEYPVLLLDDIFSELDEIRKKLLIDDLDKAQIFITKTKGSHKKIFNTENTTIYNL